MRKHNFCIQHIREKSLTIRARIGPRFTTPPAKLIFLSYGFNRDCGAKLFLFDCQSKLIIIERGHKSHTIFITVKS